jgi:hypothetical protein
MNNFERCYLQSTENEKAMGVNWYLDSHNYLKEMSNYFDIPLNVTCGIVAVLSPMIAWQQNVNLAYHLLKFKCKIPKNIKNPSFPANFRKAIKIYKTKKVFPYLRGEKVTQFYQNLLYPFKDTSITIDTFMIACYYNLSDKKDCKKYFVPGQIEILKNEIKILSEKYSLLPLQFQAIVWIAYHREVKSMQSYSGQLTLKIF